MKDAHRLVARGAEPCQQRRVRYAAHSTVEELRRILRSHALQPETFDMYTLAWTRWAGVAEDDPRKDTVEWPEDAPK